MVLLFFESRSLPFLPSASLVLSLYWLPRRQVCVAEGDAAVASPNKPEAQQAIALKVVLAKGVDSEGL